MALVEMAQVPEAFVEVTVYSNEGQCSLVGRRQRVLYKNAMQGNFVASHGRFPVHTAELLTRLERGEEAWVPDLHSSDESADEGPVKPTLKRLPKGGTWWGRYRSPVTYPTSDSSNSDDELESEAEEEKPQRGGQRLMVFHRNLLASSKGNLKQRDSCKNGPQLKKHSKSQVGLVGESKVKEKTTSGDCQNTCSDCGRSFKSKLSLSNHQRKHTREKPYRCSCCGERFATQKVLAAHQMSHAEEKGYKHPSSMKTATKLQMVHPKQRPYKCTQCEKSFKMKDYLVQHEKIHSKERPYKCPSCGRDFIRKEHLNRHKMIHRSQKNDTSPKTAKVVRVESSPVASKKKSSIDTEKTITLNTRLQRFSVNRFKCQFCGRCMRAKALLVDHERIHREERGYKCSQCNKSFYRKHDFEKHKTVHLRRQPDDKSHKRMKQQSEKSSPSDSGKFHLAEDCSENPVDRKIITRSFHRAQRQKLLTKKKVFKCQYCGKCLSASSSLIKHERIHRGERPYKCQDCGESFYQKHHLDRHLVTHRSRKPLKHSKNMRRMNVKSSLPVLGGVNTRQKHYKGLIRDHIVTRSARLARQPTIHTGEKLYKCQFCRKVMRKKNSLLIHERTHKRSKQYTCPECGKKFSQKNYLSCHQRSHMRKKLYKCSDSDKSLTMKKASLHCGKTQGKKLRFLCLKCGKSFNDKYHLRRHQIIHAGTKPFKCVTCGKGFIQNWHLRRHENTHLKAGNHKQPAEPEENQLFSSAANGVSSEKKDQRDPPVNTNGQMTSRTEERNTSPNMKMAFKRSKREDSYGPEQGEMPTEAEIDHRALLFRKNKRKHQNHKGTEVSIDQLLQTRRGQAEKDDARLHKRQTKNDLGQHVQPTKCSKKTSLQSLRNEKVQAGWPLGMQANSVRKSQRETQLAGKQCRSCFCQQEEPEVAAPGRKSNNSSQREMQANVSSNMSKRALTSCKPRKALVDPQSQPSRMEANESDLVSQGSVTVKSEAVNITKHQTLPRKRTIKREPANSTADEGIAFSQDKSEKLLFKHRCAKCKKCFRSRANLLIHEKYHSGSRPFPCTQCDKTFYDLTALNVHKRIHTGEKPYKCAECPFRCNVSSNLSRHKRTHVRERPLACHLCDKRFWLSHSLQAHLKTHLDNEPYKCSDCGRVFTQENFLKLHRRFKHSSEAVE